MNCLTFQGIVTNEEHALEYLRAFCWSEGEVACPKCGDLKIYRIQSNRYRCQSCKYSFHDLSGRWLGLLNLPIAKVLWLIKLMELGTTALECSKQLELSYPTALKALRVVRLAIFFGDSRGVFAKCRVEVDEAYFGGRKKGKRGRGVSGKVAVFGMKTRDGQARMEVIEDVSSVTLMESILRNVEKGSMVYSDKFKAYNELSSLGYTHKRIDHSKYFANGHIHTNGIEGFWSYVKNGLAKYHGVSKKELPLYLKEQEFRFNNRGKDLFSLMVTHCCDLVPSFL